jgi:hypothetical protein
VLFEPECRALALPCVCWAPLADRRLVSFVREDGTLVVELSLPLTSTLADAKVGVGCAANLHALWAERRVGFVCQRVSAASPALRCRNSAPVALAGMHLCTRSPIMMALQARFWEVSARSVVNVWRGVRAGRGFVVQCRCKQVSRQAYGAFPHSHPPPQAVTAAS